MARIRTVLKAVATAFWRDQKSIGSLATNNLFVVTALLLGKAGAFLFLLAGLLVLFPLSGDPLRRIPAERYQLWPLTPRERRLLRLLSPLLNPVSWLVLAAGARAIRGRVSAGLWLVLAGFFLAGFLLPSIAPGTRDGVLRRVPALGGRLNQLVRKNIRELLQTLDFYCALTLSLAGAAYRLLDHDVPAEAGMAMTMLVVLALSSLAQNLFGLEGADSFTRYRLLPVEGWRLLAAKGAAWLILVALLTLPLAPVAGLAAGFAALAVGQAWAVTENRPQSRWRFSSGGSLGNGVLQIFALCGACVTAFRITPLVIVPCALLYVISTWYYGRRLTGLG